MRQGNRLQLNGISRGNGISIKAVSWGDLFLAFLGCWTWGIKTLQCRSVLFSKLTWIQSTSGFLPVLPLRGGGWIKASPSLSFCSINCVWGLRIKALSWLVRKLFTSMLTVQHCQSNDCSVVLLWLVTVMVTGISQYEWEELPLLSAIPNLLCRTL